MRIAIGSDHAGFNLKEMVKGILLEMNHSYEDFGCFDTSSVDYPDIGFAVADAVAQGKFDQGILICGSGIGMCITANKVDGIRAAVCHDTFSARGAREHNDANVLCLGERVIGLGLAREIVTAYLASEFMGGRHARRLEKVRAREC
ncbi:MAG: ribose 5-phosphate isomerase B [Chloroflexi bacterium]|nr:ribose 5-phosphate isomerase B [Chloroflexota bacterium]